MEGILDNEYDDDDEVEVDRGKVGGGMFASPLLVLLTRLGAAGGSGSIEFVPRVPTSAKVSSAADRTNVIVLADVSGVGVGKLPSSLPIDVDSDDGDDEAVAVAVAAGAAAPG